MPKKVYVGVEGKARKVKKMYVGIENKARKVKKAYIGVAGKARLFFSSGELSYYGTATALSDERATKAATTVGNHAIIGGGRYRAAISNNYGTVDAYDTSLTKTAATALTTNSRDWAATTVGNYALFGGGQYYDNYNNALNCGGTVYSYDTSLTQKVATKFTTNRTETAATTVGDYALFGGGYAYTTQYDYNTGMPYQVVTHQTAVDAYNTSLTKSVPTALSKARTNLAATTVGNYALFGGGQYGTTGATGETVVDAYNASLTRTTPTALSNPRRALAATTVGDYALFGGGRSHTSQESPGRMGTFYTTVDAYNASLTRTTPTVLSQGRSDLAATTVGDFAIFGGGLNGQTSYATVDAYDASLTRTTPTALSQARDFLAATTVGDFALFAGGGLQGGANSAYTTVDVYTAS